MYMPYRKNNFNIFGFAFSVVKVLCQFANCV